MARTRARSSDTVARRQVLCWMAGSGGLAAGALLSGHSGPPTVDAQVGSPVVGSWFALLNPPSGPVGGLITFNGDGTLTQTSTEASHQSAGHGAWQQVNDQQYLFIIRWFDFGPDGTATGSGTSRGLIQVNDANDAYTGRAHIDHADLAGNIVDSHDTPAQARRIVPQPLP